MKPAAALKTIAEYLTDPRLALALLAISVVAALVQVVAAIYIKVRDATCDPTDGTCTVGANPDAFGSALYNASLWSAAITSYLAMTGGWLAYLAIELKGKK